jgi:hypothetical protein
MSKVTNYLMIMTGLIIMLTFAGINTGAHIILSATGILTSPESFTGSTWFLAVVALLTSVGVATITIGFITKTSVKDILMATYLLFLIYFVAEFINIIVWTNGQYASDGSWSWVSYIIAAVFSMLAIGFLSSVIDFYQGGT